MKGLKIEEMAYKIGVTRQTFISIEKGTSPITVERLYNIADVLDCNVTDILPATRRKEILSAEDAKNLGEISQLPSNILKTLRKLGADINDISNNK